MERRGRFDGSEEDEPADPDHDRQQPKYAEEKSHCTMLEHGQLNRT
jgi:hypothetical protein